ncbi:UNVERIFIED_ORG: hypothetical protein GGE63_004612 [Rhizobium esperanzae]
MPKDEQIIIVQGHCGRAIYFRRKVDAAAEANCFVNSPS